MVQVAVSVVDAQFLNFVAYECLDRSNLQHVKIVVIEEIRSFAGKLVCWMENYAKAFRFMENVLVQRLKVIDR